LVGGTLTENNWCGLSCLVADQLLRLDGVDKTSVSTLRSDSLFYQPTSNLADGAHTAYFSIADFAKNRSMTNWTFNIDSTPPQITLVLPASTNTPVMPGDQLQILVTDLPGGGSLQSTGVTAIFGATQLTNMIRVGDTYTFTIPLDLQPGSLALGCRAIDVAGNDSGTNWTLQLIPRPGSLLSFTAQIDDNAVNLYWQTTNTFTALLVRIHVSYVT
jgi:hypothetical protein